MQKLVIELSDHTYDKLVAYCDSQNMGIEEGMTLLIDRQIKHHQNNELFLKLIDDIKALTRGTVFDVKALCQNALGETNDAITMQRKLVSFIRGKKIAEPYNPWSLNSDKNKFERS